MRPTRRTYIACIVATCLLRCATQTHAQNTTFQYFYDDIGQLTKVIDSSGNEVDYIYDPVGNLLQIKRGTAPPATTLAIFAFSPLRGDIGETVTIQGQAFSTSLSANTVQFNGIAAAVVSATSATITSVVPSGATTGPISVTVGSATVTSSVSFTVSAVPSIVSLSRKSALFNTVINNLRVTGTNLLDATFSFQTPAIAITSASITSGTSASLNLRTGAIAGTFGLVASGAVGNSSTAITKSNRFTVVDPASTADTDGDGYPDALEAFYGTDPLDPSSHPSPSQIDSAGEADSAFFSVLNIKEPPGLASVNVSDSTDFSVLNTDDFLHSYPAEAESILLITQTSPTVASQSFRPSKPLDTDGDGYPDALEIALGSDPRDPNSTPVVPLPTEADSTVFSVLNATRPTVASATRSVQPSTSVSEQNASNNHLAKGEPDEFHSNQRH